VRPQAFAERGAEDPGTGDDDIVTQIKAKRNMLGDLIAAKDVQVRGAAVARRSARRAVRCAAHVRLSM
jgi:hypothetical protein